ncbi:hypothetical protein R3P38DRAFT_2688689 [Favolaschia claudopus]|uniref:MYND-type domain-containing protein n=1 Tax=Favolaschia claudopus TaxID=2862362 RepID=A0AAW0D5Q5_9AGAR
MTDDASSAPPPHDDDRLPMFHDGLPSHVHPRCSHCLQVQRSYKTPLALCKACGMAMYCSKDCQVAHWPSHKSDCKTHKAERLRLAQKTGSDTAFTDLASWMRFHDATLKNCAIASMQLPSFSHMERKAVFCVYLRHEPGDLSQPPHKRFVIGTARRGNFPDDINPMSDLRGSLYLRYPQFCEEGRDEFGNNFYGVIRIGVFVVFGCDEEGVPDWITERYIHFSIDKETAKARRVARDVEGTLQEYVRRGERMRFCCGPIPGAKDVCCCGGLFDHSEFEKAEPIAVELVGDKTDAESAVDGKPPDVEEDEFCPAKADQSMDADVGETTDAPPPTNQATDVQPSSTATNAVNQPTSSLLGALKPPDAAALTPTPTAPRRSASPPPPPSQLPFPSSTSSSATIPVPTLATTTTTAPVSASSEPHAPTLESHTAAFDWADSTEDDDIGDIPSNWIMPSTTERYIPPAIQTRTQTELQLQMMSWADSTDGDGLGDIPLGWGAPSPSLSATTIATATPPPTTTTTTATGIANTATPTTRRPRKPSSTAAHVSLPQTNPKTKVKPDSETASNGFVVVQRQRKRTKSIK